MRTKMGTVKAVLTRNQGIGATCSLWCTLNDAVCPTTRGDKIDIPCSTAPVICF